LASLYVKKRDLLLDGLESAGFRTYCPRGAYYIMTDIESFGFTDDVAFSRFLVEEMGLAVVPGSSFYANPERGTQQVRFCFCKEDETLHAAIRRLLPLQDRLSKMSGSRQL
jgi:aminotransferase